MKNEKSKKAKNSPKVLIPENHNTKDKNKKKNKIKNKIDKKDSPEAPTIITDNNIHIHNIPTKSLVTCKRFFEVLIQILLLLSAAVYILTYLGSINIISFILYTSDMIKIVNLSAIGLFLILHVTFELTSVFFSHLTNHVDKTKFEAIFKCLTHLHIRIQLKDQDDFILQEVQIESCKDATNIDSLDELIKKSTYLKFSLDVFMKNEDHLKLLYLISEHNKKFPIIKTDLVIDNFSEYLIVNNSMHSTWKNFHVTLFIFLCCIGLGEFYRFFACCCVHYKEVKISKFVSGINDKPVKFDTIEKFTEENKPIIESQNIIVKNKNKNNDDHKSSEDNEVGSKSNNESSEEQIEDNSNSNSNSNDDNVMSINDANSKVKLNVNDKKTSSDKNKNESINKNNVEYNTTTKIDNAGKLFNQSKKQMKNK